jgi:hypothetical protein
MGPAADSGASLAQVSSAQAVATAAACQDATQSHSMLKPGMVDTVTLQP